MALQNALFRNTPFSKLELQFPLPCKQVNLIFDWLQLLRIGLVNMKTKAVLFIIKGISWVMLELGNALGFLIGPLLVPNPPETTNIWKNQTNTISNRSFSKHPKVDTMTMREDIMLLMYSRKPLQFCSSTKHQRENQL